MSGVSYFETDGIVNTTAFVDATDPTKRILFDCSGISTGTTVSFVLPNTNSSVVTLVSSDALTNKTLTSNTNNITARGLWVGSGAASVSTYTATAPTSGQVLTATSGTTATWQNSRSGSAVGSKGYIQYRGDSTGSVDASENFQWNESRNTLAIGADANSNAASFADCPVLISDTTNSYFQINLQNNSDGKSASTDLVLTNDTGNDNSGYINLGINSSRYDVSDYNSGSVGDGYLSMNDGDLAIITENSHQIGFFTNGTTSTQLRAAIPAVGGLVMGTGALSTSATNGFVYVAASAGAPTGVPTSYTGRVPITVDSTNCQIYFYCGAWRAANDAPDFSTTKPSAPTNGLKVFSRLRSGNRAMATVDPAGVTNELQSALYQRNYIRWMAQGSGTTVFLENFGNSATGTATTRGVASGSLLLSTRRVGYVSNATAGSSAGTRHALQQFWRGNASNLGGFLYVARFGLSSASAVATQRSFVGLVGSTAVLANADPSSNTNILGFGVDAADSTWTFMHNAAVTTTKDALTGTFSARDLSVSLFEARIYCKPNDTTIYYSLQVLGGGSLFEGSTSTNIPTNSTFLSPQIWTNNGTTGAAVGIDVLLQYVETQY